jgi:16S rRNA (uracil1498-N3)-methyltransferase
LSFQSDIPALFSSETPNSDDVVELDSDEARHARALRLEPGRDVMLLNGIGWRMGATIESMSRNGLSVRVRDRSFEERLPGGYIDLAVGALSDRSRYELIVEKGVELGLRRLIPLNTERAEGSVRHERLERIARAALKQSQSAWLPRLAPTVDFATLQPIVADYDRTLLFHEQPGSGRESFGTTAPSLCQSKSLALIGPEGGFSESEAAWAIDKLSATPVSLGFTRLRTETAAIVVLACIRELCHNV